MVYLSVVVVGASDSLATNGLGLCVRGGNSERQAEFCTGAKLITKDEFSTSSRHDTKPMLAVRFSSTSKNELLQKKEYEK